MGRVLRLSVGAHQQSRARPSWPTRPRSAAGQAQSVKRSTSTCHPALPPPAPWSQATPKKWRRQPVTPTCRKSSQQHSRRRPTTKRKGKERATTRTSGRFAHTARCAAQRLAPDSLRLCRGERTGCPQRRLLWSQQCGGTLRVPVTTLPQTRHLARSSDRRRLLQMRLLARSKNRRTAG